MKKAKTPQQEKRQSYAQDRRNGYGESGARSRHSSRRNKRALNGANRRTVTTMLAGAKGPASVDADAHLQGQVEGTKPTRWQKAADVSLCTSVEGRLRRRATL